MNNKAGYLSHMGEINLVPRIKFRFEKTAQPLLQKLFWERGLGELHY